MSYPFSFYDDGYSVRPSYETIGTYLSSMLGPEIRSPEFLSGTERPVYTRPVYTRPVYESSVYYNPDSWQNIFRSSDYSNNRNNSFADSGVNNDPDLRREMVKYFYEKLKYTWLPEYFNDLYKYFVVKDGSVSYIKSIAEYDTSTEYNEIKANYIVKHIFEKIDMEALLEKYVKKRNLKWYDLKKNHKADIKEHVHSKIEKHIRNRVYKY